MPSFHLAYHQSWSLVTKPSLEMTMSYGLLSASMSSCISALIFCIGFQTGHSRQYLSGSYGSRVLLYGLNQSGKFPSSLVCLSSVRQHTCYVVYSLGPFITRLWPFNTPFVLGQCGLYSWDPALVVGPAGVIWIQWVSLLLFSQ